MTSATRFIRCGTPMRIARASLWSSGWLFVVFFRSPTRCGFCCVCAGARASFYSVFFFFFGSFFLYSTCLHRSRSTVSISPLIGFDWIGLALAGAPLVGWKDDLDLDLERAKISRFLHSWHHRLGESVFLELIGFGFYCISLWIFTLGAPRKE